LSLEKNSELFNRILYEIPKDTSESISITFEHCKFSKIASKVFVRDRKFKTLKELKFSDSTFEDIQDRAFDFFSSDINLEINGSKKLFKLHKDIFVDFKVSNFLLNDVRLEEFTTQVFWNMKQTGILRITNSYVKGNTIQKVLKPLNLSRIEFNNVEFDIYQNTIDVTASEAVFSNCKLKWMDRNSQDSLKIKSNYIKFNDGSALINPSENCLQGLTHINGRAELVLDNVLLINPAIGALYTKMPNVRYNDIKIDSRICDCDLAQKLSNYQVSKLIYSISCKNGYDSYSPIQCDRIPPPPPKEPRSYDTFIILGIILLIIIVIVSVVLIIFCRACMKPSASNRPHRRQDKNRIKEWEKSHEHIPGMQDEREPSIRFNQENLYERVYFSVYGRISNAFGRSGSRGDSDRRTSNQLEVPEAQNLVQDPGSGAIVKKNKPKPTILKKKQSYEQRNQTFQNLQRPLPEIPTSHENVSTPSQPQIHGQNHKRFHQSYSNVKKNKSNPHITITAGTPQASPAIPRAGLP